MKSLESRDKMIELVKEYFTKYRTFASIPLVKTLPLGAILVVLADSRHEWSYVESLHAACATGKLPIGRHENALVLAGVEK